jgi:hypothetical protein
MAASDKTYGAPTSDDVERAYRAYRHAKTAYLATLARYSAACADGEDPLFETFSQDTATLRVLHALSVGYGLSDMIYRVATRAEVAQAQLRGLTAKDELHGGFTLTHKGVEMLRRWTDYIVLLTEAHPRYKKLWRAVTELGDFS